MLVKFLFEPVNLKYTKFNRSCVYNYKKEVCLNKGISFLNLDNFLFKVVCGEGGLLTKLQLDSCLQILRKILKNKKKGKKKDKVSNCNVIRVLLNVALTKKSAGIRMGKGKGEVVSWVVGVDCGQILFVVYPFLDNSINLLKITRLLNSKLPIPIFIIGNKKFVS